ncbi:MAG: sigma-70 family RNA polymerase sigma factor [Planctomycetaceae bacterium]|nr:sigma-70 family RNA polymerase sigma factor [Planctomycetaceae bacterium]
MALTELDRSLIQRCLAHEPGAWKDFVDRYAGLFVHVIQHTGHARSIALSPEDVDDLCSDVLLAVLNDDYAVLRNFRGESSLATYLAVIARRVVVREMIRRRMSEALGHVRAHQDSVEQGLHESGRIENRDLVLHMLDGLSESEAAVVRLFHLEGKSYEDISRQLKMPENSIGPLLTRAREKLRRSGVVAK